MNLLKWGSAALMLLNVLIADVILYSSKTCPYCHDVDAYLKSVNKEVETKYIDGNPELRQELKNKGGKIQVPCLFVDGTPLYGSKNIIEWMKKHPERLEDASY